MVFEKYNKNELAKIARDRLLGLRVDDASLAEIVKASNYTPGNITLLCIRLRTVFESRGGFTVRELNDCLVNIFNIQDGLDVRCREYLEILERLRTASLDTMAYVMGVSKDTVKNEVENVLLTKGLISITSKGRSIAQ
jgi:Holliday junction resolvasome RuvABC ATP-dependent DNA helicase subunit